MTGKPLDKLTLEEFQGVSAKFGADVTEMFDLRKAMARRQLTGAPGTKEVRKQLARWQNQLAKRG
jgi:argininosuccinate lyase